MKKKLLRTVSFMLAFLLMMQAGVQAAAPKLTASITQSNVMSLAKATDADGAYLLQTAIDGGENILTWWGDAETVASGMDTGVHEETHSYSLRKCPWNSEDIYIGNKKSIRVTYTEVYRSRIMGATIPNSLRTLRWEPYVGSPSANMASDVNGVYGLLNEFSAYYWGMHAQMSMFDYYKQQKATPEQWQEFVVFAANDRLAYAEFKYYILKYLTYAKRYYPSVYKGIMENADFVKAYQKIERKYADLIVKFEKSLKEIASILEKQGYNVEIGEYFSVGKNGAYHGVGILANDYQKLISELRKPDYQAVFPKSATGGTKVKSPKLTSAANTAKRTITVKWNAVSGASGYQICYSTKKDFSSAKKVTAKASELSKKITQLTKNKTYYVKIRAYQKSSAKTQYSAWSAAKSVKLTR